MIYLDWNSTAPPAPGVADAVRAVMEQDFGNASSRHAAGAIAARHVREAREHVATLIGCESRNVFWTSGATESVNTAILGSYRMRRKGHIITQATEHKAVLEACRQVEREGGRVTTLPVDRDGLCDPSALAAVIEQDTVLVSIMWANNETGVVQSMDAISAVCRSARVPLHSDATQALGRIPIDWSLVDLMSCSAHKLGGPKGVGALIVADGHRPSPIIFGGGQENGFRAGTLNTPGIAGFGAAAKWLLNQSGCWSAVENLRVSFESQLLENLDGVRVVGAATRRLPNTSCVLIADVSGESVMMALGDIVVSTASACVTEALAPSHVLLATGRSEPEALSSVRISLGPSTTESEIKALTKRLVEIVTLVRQL